MPPNLTAVAPLRFVPVIVTLVPPAGGPVFGLTFETVGRANCACACVAKPSAHTITTRTAAAARKQARLKIPVFRSNATGAPFRRAEET